MKTHLLLVNSPLSVHSSSVASENPIQPRSFVSASLAAWSALRSMQTMRCSQAKYSVAQSSSRDISLIRVRLATPSRKEGEDVGTRVERCSRRRQMRRRAYPALRSELPITVSSKKTNILLLVVNGEDATKPRKRTPPT